MSRLIEFTSSDFPRVSKDQDLVNSETMHGYALSKFIGDELEKRGTTVDYIAEDWGWYCFLVDCEYRLAYGVMAEDDSDEFLIQFIPHKPYIRKGFFKKVDISEPLLKLQEDVYEILSDLPTSGSPQWIEG